MMLYPSIDKLLEKIDSKYSLVVLSSKRAHELHNHAEATVDSFESFKNVGRALEEIADGNIVISDATNPEDI